jgi:plasmid stability protein
MGQILIRRLDDDVKERLKARAKKHGRSLEAEARAILEGAAASIPGFGTRVSARFKGIGLTRRELETFNRAVDKRRKKRPRLVKFTE